MPDQENREKNGRKNLWRIAFLAIGSVGLWKLLKMLAVRVLYLFWKDPYLTMGNAASIGIIGGADGPTAIFITTPDWASRILPIILLAIGISGFLYLKKRKKTSEGEE